VSVMGRARVALSLALALVAGACTGGGAPPSASPALPSSASTLPAPPSTASPLAPGSTPLTKLSVGLGYIPSVQFAQFYTAQQLGYYRAAGLDVTFENKVDPDLITLVGQGALDLGIGDGTSVIPAVSQGIPIVYAATIYAQFPDVVMSEPAAGIASPAQLKGRKLGIPGKYGSSWIMLQALLHSAGLTPSDLTIVLYPDYGQSVALSQGQVEAATGFFNNEPVQLSLQGIQTNLLRVDQITPLPGPGLIVGTKTLASKADALKAFVAATLRAMNEIAANPQEGLDATFAMEPDLATDPATQRAVLNATIAIWSSDYTTAHGLGAIDPGAWTQSVAFMQSLPDGGVAKPVSVDQLVTNALLP